MGSRLAREIDPVTTVANRHGGSSCLNSKFMTATTRRPLAWIKQGEDIVCAAGNSRERAMSARRILGLESVPRVGLFAH